jgi:hypothetical protein
MGFKSLDGGSCPLGMALRLDRASRGFRYGRAQPMPSQKERLGPGNPIKVS